MDGWLFAKTLRGDSHITTPRTTARNARSNRGSEDGGSHGPGEGPATTDAPPQPSRPAIANRSPIVGKNITTPQVIRMAFLPAHGAPPKQQHGRSNVGQHAPTWHLQGSAQKPSAQKPPLPAVFKMATPRQMPPLNMSRIQGSVEGSPEESSPRGSHVSHDHGSTFDDAFEGDRGDSVQVRLPPCQSLPLPHLSSRPMHGPKPAHSTGPPTRHLSPPCPHSPHRSL
jgi:hypothetical protein